jgi:dTDP-4-amino-4,6-dideoxygalactose transaminase
VTATTPIEPRGAAIPFFPPDLFEPDRDVVLDLVYRIGTSAQKFILGEHVAAFEEAIRERTGAAHAVACASGTGALTLAVDAVGIGPGDEAVVPAFACQPLASTIVNRGATPIFADIDPWTLVMDPASVEERITPKTKALVPAHTFSVLADMSALAEIAKRHGLTVVEDAAVAQGATLDGRPAGLLGDIGLYSFFQVKALGAIGEGGIVVTDDEELATACRMLRNHGQDGVHRFLHHRVGYNSRMDEILAAFLLHRLERFEERLERRADIADYYSERFEPLRERGLVAPPKGREGRCYYVYALLSDDRDALRTHLAERGVGTHVYYPLPLPDQPAFAAFRDERHPYPNAVAAGRRNLALPIWPHLADAQVEHVAESVVAFYA